MFYTETIVKMCSESRKLNASGLFCFRILDWEFFTVGNDSYLIASNQQPGHNSGTDLNLSHQDTIIYRWKGAEKFVPAHKIQTSPSADWEVIKDGTNTYIIYANGSGRTTEIFKARLR